MATLTGNTIASTYDQLWFRSTTEPGGTSTATYIKTTENDGTDDLTTPLSLSTARVGIGNTAPTALLTVGDVTTLVTDSTTATSAVGINLNMSAAGAYAMGIRNQNVSGDGLLIQAGDQVDDYALRIEDADSANDLFAVLGNGTVGIGTASPDLRLGQKLDIATSDDFGGLSLSCWSTAVADAPVLDFKRSDHATIGNTSNAVTYVDGTNAADDCLGYIIWRGSDTSGFSNAAAIQCHVDATTGNGDMPGRLVFSTTPDGSDASSERMRITSAGKVGIGTIAPSAPLTIEAAANTGTFLRLQSPDNVDIDGNTSIGIAFSSDDNSALGRTRTDHALIRWIASETHTGSDFDGRLEFVVQADTNVDEHADDIAMVISTGHATSNASGYAANVGIGTTTPSSTLHVSSEMVNDETLVHFEYHTADNAVDASDTIMKLEFGDDSTEDGQPFFIQFQDSNSLLGYIFWDDTDSVQFVDISDYRIKSNIEPIDSSLANINKLKPCSFNKRKATKKATGFIAHELQEIYPSMVNGEKDAVDDDGKIVPQAIAYSKLIPFMIKAIQELSAKVEALENA